MHRPHQQAHVHEPASHLQRKHDFAMAGRRNHLNAAPRISALQTFRNKNKMTRYILPGCIESAPKHCMPLHSFHSFHFSMYCVQCS